MSKIYDALRRLEWERAADRARKHEIRPRVFRGGGTLAGCALGLVVGIVASTSISTTSPAAPSPAPPLHAVAPPSPAEPPTVPTGTGDDAPAPSASEPTVAAPADGPVAVQVGTFRNHDNSSRLAARLRAEGYRVTIEPSRTDDRLLVVRVGGYPDRGAAEAARAALDRLGVSGLLVHAGLAPITADSTRHARTQSGG